MTCLEEVRHSYRNVVYKLIEKRPLGKPKRIWEDNIKTDLRKNKI